MFGYDWPRLHAMLTAVPVALLSLAIALELLSLLLKKESLRQTSLLLLVIGTVGAAAAVGAGLKAEGSIDHGPALHEVMEEHEELALVTLSIFAVLSVWRVVRARRMGTRERAAALVLGVAGVAVLADTGHHGGELVFEHAAGVSNATLRAELTDRASGHEHGGGALHQHAGSTAEQHHDATAPGSNPDAHAPGTPAHED